MTHRFRFARRKSVKAIGLVGLSMAAAFVLSRFNRLQAGQSSMRMAAHAAASHELPASTSLSPTEPAVAQQGQQTQPTREPLRELISKESQSKLKTFSELNQKAVLTSFEQLERRATLADEQWLSDLGHLLTRAAHGVDENRLQDDAVDALIAARAEMISQAAEQVLSSIVANPQIEDASVSESDRRELAGRKAEVLLNWISIEPNRAAEIESRLPGTLSKKIWANVLRAQANNHP
jgi:hypothetical protein